MQVFLRKWAWDRSGFLLAILVLSGLVAGWNLPDTRETVEALAFGQIIMAIVVVIREGLNIARISVLLMGCFVSTLPCPAVAESNIECVQKAFKEYNSANLSLLQNGSPLMTVDAAVAQRRLEEAYCLQVATCVTRASASAIQYRGMFSSCLRDLAGEKSGMRRDSD
jgi:hypothetical protein